MSKKLSLIVSKSGKTTAIPKRISTGARRIHATGASLSHRPRAAINFRRSSRTSSPWEVGSVVAALPTVEEASPLVGFDGFCLDCGRHRVDIRVRRILEELLELHPVLIDKVAGKQIAKDELNLGAPDRRGRNLLNRT